MFPDAVIPDKPLDFLYPRWGMTPWAFGSYSNWALGYSLEHFVNFRGVFLTYSRFWKDSDMLILQKLIYTNCGVSIVAIEHVIVQTFTDALTSTY